VNEQDTEEARIEADPFAFEPPDPLMDAEVSYQWGADYNWTGTLKEVVDGEHRRYAGRKSDIAQAVLYHLGKPLQLDSHAFMLPVYNSNHQRQVLKCSRQVAKSTTIATMQVVESLTHNHWRSLYVSPSALQTRQYSNEKLRPTIYDSPFVKKYFTGKTVTDQVFEKTLSNGSYMFLRYAFLSAARARGIPASRVFFDEAQDLLKDNIKVISQSLSASRLSAKVPGSELLAGTPLTFSNTLEEYWRWSTQNEWLVPCDRHTPRYWNCLDGRNIGKTGLICSKPGCGMPINAAQGQWVAMEEDQFYQGFHITQLMVPWKQSVDAWKTEIVLPAQKWPEAKFNNEILGISFDSASAPVTKYDLQRCCYPTKQVEGIPSKLFHHQRRPHQVSGMRLFAGIDWGEGREEGEVVKGRKKFASWTVLTIGGYLNQDTFWAMLMKRYTGRQIDPEEIVPDVLNICGQFNVDIIGADWGHGWGVNSRLMKARGKERVMQFAYSTSLGERKKFDPEAYKYMINRNSALTNFFDDVKDQKFMFPEWAEFEWFGDSILAEYVEYNERTKTMQYDHPIDQPDDGLHSLVYCKLAADIAIGKY
jgi:hypothetical protein